MTKSAAASLRVTAAGLALKNPIILAAGTAGYGRELAGVMRLDRLGGLVTKAVSITPRAGAPSPRVAEFDGGMINAVGLANPGVEAVRRDHLPWMAQHLGSLVKIVNVVGNTEDEFSRVVAAIEEEGPHTGATDAFELNVSCPNVHAGGLEFGADPGALRRLVLGARAVTKRPLFVKLSPTLADIAATAKVAVDAGADGITVVNTIPGLVIDVRRRAPALGFGTGGVSGHALLPVGVLATWRVSRAVTVPIIGAGGVSTGAEAAQYLVAGATAVAVGTAALQDPGAPERIVSELAAVLGSIGARSVTEIVGSLEWPT